MSELTPSGFPKWKHRTTEAARDALSRFCTRKASVMTIPVNNERDADCILGDVIEERDVLLQQVSDLRTALEVRRPVVDASIECYRAMLEKRSQEGGIAVLMSKVDQYIEARVGKSEMPVQECAHSFSDYQCDKCGKGQDFEKRVDEPKGNYFCLDTKCGWIATSESRPLSRGIKVGCPVCKGDAIYR